MPNKSKSKAGKVSLPKDVVDHVAEILYICGQKFLLQNHNQSDAFEAYNTALLLKPTHAKSLHNIGVLLSQRGDFKQAAEAFEEEMKIPQGDDKDVAAICSFVESARRCGRLLEAGESLEAVKKRDPFKYFALKALIANEKGDLRKAEEFNEKALEVNPEDLQCSLNRALLKMTFGEWPGWFSEYERFLSYGKHNTRMKEFSGRTPWDGKSDIRGKRLLIVSDQGFGDAFQFSRFFSDLKKRFQPKSLTFYCQRELEEVVSSASGLDRTIGFGTVSSIHQEYDSFISLLGMLTLLEVSPSTSSSEDQAWPYLDVSPEVTKMWKERILIADQSGLPRVGMTWRGDYKHGNDHNRSMLMTDMLSVVQFPCALFSLQLGNGRNEIENSPAFIDLMDHVRDFTDTAGLIKNLDLVITVDTAIAHLAGALSIPTVVMTANPPEWRWLERSQTTCWYPKTFLARQDSPKNWGSAVRKARTLAESLIREKRSAA